MIFPPVFSLNLYRYMYNSTIYWWTDCPISFIVYLLYIIQMEKYDLSIMMLFFFFISYHSKKRIFYFKGVWKWFGTAIVILLLSETKVLYCGRYLWGGFYIKPYLLVHYNKWHLQLCYDMYTLVYNSDILIFTWFNDFC